MDTVRLELPAEPASVTEARHVVGDFASRFECDQLAVRIAVSEVVGNCAVHAYRNLQPGPVVVLARVLRERLVITVADCGGGVRPRVDSPGLGLGLPMVTRLADDLRIESDEHGTAISISFAIGPVAADDLHPATTRERAADIEAEIGRARELIRRRGGRGSVRMRPAMAGC